MSLKDDLVSYWKLDETSGTTATDAHSSNDGSNSSFTINQVGKIGRAYEVSASSNKISTSIDVSSWTAFSFSGWVYWNGGTGVDDKIFMSDETASWRQFYLARGEIAGKFDFRMGTGSAATQILSNDAVVKDTWYHVVVTTKTTGNMVMYVNGTKQTDTKTAPNSFQNKKSLYLASKEGANEAWKGKFDEYAVWDRTLTDDEVTALYNGGSGLAYDDFDAVVVKPSTLTLSTTEKEPTITIKVKPLTESLAVLNPPFPSPSPAPKLKGTLGTKEISKDFPIQALRTWETIQDLVPEERDMTLMRNRVGLH
jgi:hypothetical protein